MLFFEDGDSFRAVLVDDPHIPLTHFFYKQSYFRDSIKMAQIRLKIAMNLLNDFGIEAQGCCYF